MPSSRQPPSIENLLVSIKLRITKAGPTLHCSWHVMVDPSVHYDVQDLIKILDLEYVIKLRATVTAQIKENILNFD